MTGKKLAALLVLIASPLLGCGDKESGQADEAAEARAAMEESARVSAELAARSEQQKLAYLEQSKRDAASDTSDFLAIREGQRFLHLSAPGAESTIPAAGLSGAQVIEAPVDQPLSEFEDAAIDVVAFDHSIAALLERLANNPEWLAELDRILSDTGYLVVIDNPLEVEGEPPTLLDPESVSRLSELLAGQAMYPQDMINLPIEGRGPAGVTLIRFAREPDPI